MVKGLMPKRVKRQVGMNPIARAVARENLRKAITDQMIADNSYRQTNTTTLDVALDCAVELSKRVDPAVFNTAWNEVSGGIV